VKIDYRFEEEQLIRFMMYDIDKASNNLKDHDFLGFAECTIGRIVSAGFGGLELQLSQNLDLKFSANTASGKSKGSIILVAEELVELKEEVSGQDLILSDLNCFPLPCRE
ncbi:unnamed protein product, partial [Allacma fusca]